MGGRAHPPAAKAGMYGRWSPILSVYAGGAVLRSGPAVAPASPARCQAHCVLREYAADASAIPGGVSRRAVLHVDPPLCLREETGESPPYREGHGLCRGVAAHQRIAVEPQSRGTNRDL